MGHDSRVMAAAHGHRIDYALSEIVRHWADNRRFIHEVAGLEGLRKDGARREENDVDWV